MPLPTGLLPNADVNAHQGDPSAHPMVTKVVAASGTTQALDFNAADVFDITMTGNCTFSVTNPPALKDNAPKILILRQDGTGSRTGTFPAGWLFSGASKTLTTTASAIDRVVVRKDPTVAAQFLAELTKGYA